MLKTFTLADGQMIRVGPMFVEDFRIGHPVYRVVNERPQRLGVFYDIPSEVSDDDLRGAISWLLAQAAQVAERTLEPADRYIFRASYPDVLKAQQVVAVERRNSRPLEP